jgi:hypothetical protein
VWFCWLGPNRSSHNCHNGALIWDFCSKSYFIHSEKCGDVYAPSDVEPSKRTIGEHQWVSVARLIVGCWFFIGCTGSVYRPEMAVAFRCPRRAPSDHHISPLLTMRSPTIHIEQLVESAPLITPQTKHNAVFGTHFQTTRPDYDRHHNRSIRTQSWHGDHLYLSECSYGVNVTESLPQK